MRVDSAGAWWSKTVAPGERQTTRKNGHTGSMFGENEILARRARKWQNNRRYTEWSISQENVFGIHCEAVGLPDVWQNAVKSQTESQFGLWLSILPYLGLSIILNLSSHYRNVLVAGGQGNNENNLVLQKMSFVEGVGGGVLRKKKKKKHLFCVSVRILNSGLKSSVNAEPVTTFIANRPDSHILCNLTTLSPALLFFFLSSIVLIFLLNSVLCYQQ